MIVSEVISNTSPLLYLYRINAIDWLPELFTQVWTTEAVVRELREGAKRDYKVPIQATIVGYKLITL